MNDPVFRAIEKHDAAQNSCLNMIASENYFSPAVLKAMGSRLANKYAEGYPGRRYYGGCGFADVIENIAVARAKKLFGAEHANVQPHDGTGANMAVFQAVLKPGDRILSMDLPSGGHLSHGAPVSSTGILYDVYHYGVNADGWLDYLRMRDIAREVKPKLIICGTSSYPRDINFFAFRRIADNVGAYLLADIAHTAGIVAAGRCESPVPYADFVTMTCQKTLRAGRGGIILCKEQYAKAIDKAVFPGTQGGPLMNMIAAKAVGLGEALEPEFRDYIDRVLENAHELARRLIFVGFTLVSGGTDNHMVLIDLRPLGITGKEAEQKLLDVGIICNKNAVPNDTLPRTECGGIRLGTPCITSRGLKLEDMETIAGAIMLTLKEGEKGASVAKKLLEPLIKAQEGNR